VNCITWSPKDQSSEKSWYVIGRSSFGKDDSPGKNIELLEWCKRPEIRFRASSNESGSNPEIMKFVKAQVLL